MKFNKGLVAFGAFLLVLVPIIIVSAIIFNNGTTVAGGYYNWVYTLQAVQWIYGFGAIIAAIVFAVIHKGYIAVGLFVGALIGLFITFITAFSLM